MNEDHLKQKVNINMNNNSNPKQFNLDPIHPAIMEGISLVTAVKNRKESLEEALKTWVAQEQVDEIIIVDWTSDESLIPLVNKFNDTRIVLVIAENQHRWIQTKAFNLGARFTSRDKIMKIDGDIKITQDFFNKHPLKEGVFYTGNWALGRNSNETHLNGTVFLYRKDFFNVNGYNELFKLYGYDDTDLYARLEKTGLTRSDFNNDCLYHIEHENRVSASELSNYMDKLSDTQKADISILMNRYLLTRSFSWGKGNRMINPEVEKLDENIYTCMLRSSIEPDIPVDILEQALKISILDRLRIAGQGFSNRLFETATRNEIIDLYYIFHNKSGNQISENLYNLIYRYDQTVSGELSSREEEIKSWSWRFGHAVFSFISRFGLSALFLKKNKPG